MKQLIVIATITTLYSCTVFSQSYVSLNRQQFNPYYVTPAANTPLFFEKGDLTLNPNISFSSKRFGVDFMFAVKPFTNIGFMLHVNEDSYGAKGLLVDTRPDGHYNNTRGELGVGYTKSVSKSWLLETFIGAGFAMLDNSHFTGNSTINQTHIFLQPAIGYRNEKRTTEVGFTLRIQGVNYDIQIASYEAYKETYTAKQIDELRKSPWQLFLEPGVFTRFGGKRFKINLGVNYSQNLTFSDMQAKKLTATVGATIQLNIKDKLKKRTKPATGS